MNSKFAIGLVLASLTLVACGKDVDTPLGKRKSSYLKQTLAAKGPQVLNCETGDVQIPEVKAHEELEQLIVRIHATNINAAMAKMSVRDLQTTYRDCIRPALVELFE